MRKVSELYGVHNGADIYIVGTGTSCRVFPLDFLNGRITIALNQAWKLFKPTYGITMMPRLNIPEFIAGESSQPEIIWITKPSKVREQCTPQEVELASERFFAFENNGPISVTPLDVPSESGRVLEWVAAPNPEKLYLWTSISQTAMNLAANMGARNIILIGCDNCAIGDNHHAHDQHTMWKGEDPQVRYRQYYEGSAEVRAVLRNRGVNVVSMTPFLKLDEPELDFKRLCTELERETYIPNADIPRGTTLADDNKRYGVLTRYIIRKNLNHWAAKFSGAFSKNRS